MADGVTGLQGPKRYTSGVARFATLSRIFVASIEPLSSLSCPHLLERFLRVILVSIRFRAWKHSVLFPLLEDLNMEGIRSGYREGNKVKCRIRDNKSVRRWPRRKKTRVGYSQTVWIIRLQETNDTAIGGIDTQSNLKEPF